MKQPFVLATLVTLMTLTSPLAYAIGLGQPAVHSYLHAPLNVSIPLLDADQYDPGQLRVSIAERSAFQAAGLDWKRLAESIRADIHAGSDAPEVRLTSSAPANVPWLDLLLTLTTPDGDITRDVTLLFDPPVHDTQDDAGQSAVSSGAELQDVALEGARNVAESVGSDASVARVKNGDTLWSVAERLKPASASIEQVMLALVAANPRAFPSGNINGMNAGFELSVPTRAQMLSRSKAQAAQTIDYMNTAWRIRGPSGPVHVPLGPSGSQPAEPEEPAQDATDAEASATSPTLNRDALGVARQLGQGAETSELEQDQARLERITQQRDRLREEVSRLKAEVSQLTDELALQEVELARQEMRDVTPLPELPAEEGAAASEAPPDSAAVSPPTSELAIAWRGVVAIASEYRWLLAGAALLLLGLRIIWRYRRRSSSTSSGMLDNDEDAMLGRSQAAGLASSRSGEPRGGQRDESRSAEEVAFEPLSQDNTRSSS